MEKFGILEGLELYKTAIRIEYRFRMLYGLYLTISDIYKGDIIEKTEVEYLRLMEARLEKAKEKVRKYIERCLERNISIPTEHLREILNKVREDQRLYEQLLQATKKVSK